MSRRAVTPDKKEILMVQAIWNDTVIAESAETVVVEGNHYFPRDDVRMNLLSDSSRTTHCPWKGTAHYYDLEVDGACNAAAAWYYPDPKPKASAIEDRIAFWKGVKVV